MLPIILHLQVARREDSDDIFVDAPESLPTPRATETPQAPAPRVTRSSSKPSTLATSGGSSSRVNGQSKQPPASSDEAWQSVIPQVST